MQPIQFVEKASWGYDKFIFSYDLNDPERNLLSEDTLRIHCRIMVEGGLRHVVEPGGHPRRPPKTK